jgi:hypothetical protein
MLYIIFTLYSVALVAFVVLYFFIAYHLAKYSINPHLHKILLLFFVIISTLLLFSNILLFFNINWNEILFRIF